MPTIYQSFIYQNVRGMESINPYKNIVTILPRSIGETIVQFSRRIIELVRQKIGVNRDGRVLLKMISICRFRSSGLISATKQKHPREIVGEQMFDESRSRTHETHPIRVYTDLFDVPASPLSPLFPAS